MTDFFDIALPKWPGLLVAGDPIKDYDRVCEVLIRTNTFISTNDHKFQAQVEKLMNIPPLDWGDTSHENWLAHNKAEEAYHKDYQILRLHYLYNSRIASSWIGGPHGWLNWDGFVGTCNYNIGKWPSIEHVFNEWKMIAESFPFIALRSQLLNEEICENENPIPLVEFNVKDGKVEMIHPTSMLTMPERDSIEEYWKRKLFDTSAERGTTIDVVKDALERTKKSIKTR